MLNLINYDESGVIIALPAKIDISNYEAFGEELKTLRREHPDGTATLDMEELVYMSSSGIRVLVELVKNESAKPGSSIELYHTSRKMQVNFMGVRDVMESIRGGMLADMDPKITEKFLSVRPNDSTASWALRSRKMKPS